jgi:hypothetical protein
MLFSLRSICLSSASTAASPLVEGPVASVPAGADLADPVVTPVPEFAGEPDELAVPALLVPGAGGIACLEELPAPLGSLPALFRPPALAGPDGTPLTPALPAPAEPALGEPAAEPLPDDGPLAAPPALPPLAPPALCANEIAGPERITIATIDAVIDSLAILKISLCGSTDASAAGSSPEQFPQCAIESKSRARKRRPSRA